MKVAVIGPIAKDIISIDGVSSTHVGAITYYVAHVLKNLGIYVKVFGTYAKEDEKLVRENFKNIELESLYTEKTIVHKLSYTKQNPDTRETIVPAYSPNIFPIEDKLLNELKSFDYVILGPLYYENIPYELFEKIKDYNLVLNNFGLFTYYEDGKPVRKNPENLARVAKFLKYLFLDESEIKFAAQKSEVDECAKYFLNLGVGTVVVTRGSKGSIIFTKNKQYSIPAFPPGKLTDPTGAGDTYMAAFIASTELFGDIQRQGEFAAMAATMAIEKHGAFDGTLKEVMDRLNNYEIK